MILEEIDTDNFSKTKIKEYVNNINKIKEF